MATLVEMLRQGSFENPNNPYSSNLLADALRGSVSNAESLGRGAAVAPLGIFGDINALAREYVTPRLPAKVQAALESLPAAPTTEAILANIPRGTEARRESSGMEQLGAAMNPVGPVEVAKGITKGLGAYGKLAGEAINDAMVYGRGPLAEVTPQPMRMDVYHGSPHGPFEKFDPSKARTGEGNATFGEGAYLAQARGTGETYRNALSQPELFKGNRQIKTTAGSDIDTAKAWLQESFEAGAKNPFEDAMAKIAESPLKDDKGVISALKKLQDKGVEMKKSGYLYKVDLPDESIAKMLDYDKPLSQQAPEVQAALADLGIKVDKKKIDEFHDALYDALHDPNSTVTVDQLPKAPRDWRGEDILKMLEMNPSQYFSSVMEGKELTGAMINPKAGVSELLAKKGIPGVRYLDQMSRDAGDGTSNFVVFPKYQNSLTIKEINDKPLGAYK
jgi:hypothetical protein